MNNLEAIFVDVDNRKAIPKWSVGYWERCMAIKTISQAH
ncbi:MAG: hypothetical protein CENE_00379 [Candidatus Celerinatantimonas neptuna]|nr:MAG: hypothetical protein CENE_00379 [Candidatus Celerinatantimonas neptuna]